MSVFFSTFTIMENILLYFCCICCIMFFALKMFIKITFSTPRIVTFFYIQNRGENFWEFLLYFSPYYTTRKFSQIVSHRNNKKLCSQKITKKMEFTPLCSQPPFFFTFFQGLSSKNKIYIFHFSFFLWTIWKKNNYNFYSSSYYYEHINSIYNVLCFRIFAVKMIHLCK